VVDAAVGLKKLGHDVDIYTSFHDPSRCFDETRDGTLNVRVLGGWPVPRSFGGRFIVICAILRQLTLAVVLLLQIATLGFTPRMIRRLLCFSLFWHALDIVWIGVFTIVYLGAFS